MGATIVLADAVQADRDEFKNALQGSSFRVVAEAPNKDQMQLMVERNKPWLVAIDVELPGGGAAAVEWVRSHLPNGRVLVLHGSSGATLVQKAMAAGGHGHTLKPIDSVRLMAALTTINVESKPPAKTESKLIARLRKTLIVHYKKADEGMFSKKHEAVTTEISLVSVEMTTEEKLPVGKTINAEFELPGEASLKAVMNVVKVEAVAGLPRFTVQLTWSSMQPADRERLRQVLARFIQKKTESPT